MNNDVSTSQNSTTTTPIEIPDSEPLALDDDVQIINNQDNRVTLEDDSDVIIVENNPVIVDIDSENNPVIVDIDSDDLEIIETNNTPIVIEDEDPNCVINPLNVIKAKQDQLLDTVCQENNLLAQVIEEAINLDSSGSMKRIIQRTLIPLYLNCKISYKESEIFKNTLKRTTILLETAPHLKYSHIKSLCESLKFTRIKMKLARVPQQQTNKSSPKKRKHKHNRLRKHKKRKKDTTTVDRTKPKKNKANDDSIIPEDNNTSNKNTTIETEIPAITSVSPTSDKENIQTTHNIQEANETLNNNAKNIPSTDTTHNNVDNNTTSGSNSLLTPHYAVNTVMPPEPSQQTVESLEKQIAVLKKELEEIEEQEIMADNMLSPYIIADTLKAKIVKLYQELCELMGAESTKRHEVKLQVVNGHPPGPARCLEEYINDNIDEYGNPPFPDIFEVVRCVKRAVDEDRLRWNKKQIVAEAQVLLKHYGHAIQKRRKKREWRDMVSRCKEELVDPAELDPVLEAKLLQNSRIAKRNEDEILERYAKLEENSSNPAFRLSLETSADGSESDDREDTHGRSHINKPVEKNIREAPSLIMADSTTNLDNLQGCPIIVNSNTQSNIQSASNAINVRNGLEINPQSCSSIINSINVLNSSTQGGSNNTVDSNVRNTNSIINSRTNLTTNQQNCPILLLNSPDNVIPNLHRSICYINSTPVLATRIQGNLQNAPNNLQGNLQNRHNFINLNNSACHLQNAPVINHNNLAGNLQSGDNFINTFHNFINANNLEGNQLSGNNFINTSNNFAGNLQTGNNFINTFHNFINANNLEGNQQRRNNFINTSNNLAGNLQSGPSINSNNLEDNLQSGPSLLKKYLMINSSNNLAGNQQRGHNFINSPNNLEGNQQGGNNFINTSNNLEDNPQSGSSFNSSNNLERNVQNCPNIIRTSNNLEGNQQSRPSIINTSDNSEGNQHSCPIDSTTDPETQSTVTNIGNIEYNRTIMMDSEESDIYNERNDQTDIVTDTNTVKERDKSDIDEIEYKIRVKKEEDDVIKLLSELGSDCVATVFDIEDPFLVIEISDSSDEE